ncbi:MAG: O-antigen ligase family protein [Campylobacteraceae bacterium]|nr:O-antigen ligase family protein [Campylobacteraceae bacterium]
MTKILKNIKLDLSSILNYFFVLYAFCLPLSRAGISFTAGMIILLWLAQGKYKEKIKVLLEVKFIVVALLLTAYLLVSSFWGDVLEYNFSNFKRFWYYLILFAIITSVKKETIMYMISSFFLGMLISEIISYGLVFELWTTNHGSASDPSPFMNHLSYTLYLAITCAILLSSFILEKTSKLKRLYYGLFFLTATINLFLTGGRTGQITFIFVILMLIFTNIKHKVLAFVISVVLLSSVFVGAYNYSDTFKSRVGDSVYDLKQVYNDKNFSGSWGLRLSTWVATYNILKDNILFGTGISDLNMDYIKYVVNNPDIRVDDPSVMLRAGYHSEIIEVTAAGGLIGLFLFLSCFYYLAKLKIKNMEIRNIKTILVTGFLFSVISDLFLKQQFGANLFILFAGIIIAQSRFEETETKV